MKKIFASFVLFVVLSLLAGCGSGNRSTSAPMPAPAPRTEQNVFGPGQNLGYGRYAGGGYQYGKVESRSEWGRGGGVFDDSWPNSKTDIPSIPRVETRVDTETTLSEPLSRVTVADIFNFSRRLSEVITKIRTEFRVPGMVVMAAPEFSQEELQKFIAHTYSIERRDSIRGASFVAVVRLGNRAVVEAVERGYFQGLRHERFGTGDLAVKALVFDQEGRRVFSIHSYQHILEELKVMGKEGAKYHPHCRRAWLESQRFLPGRPQMNIGVRVPYLYIVQQPYCKIETHRPVYRPYNEGDSFSLNASLSLGW